MGHIQLVGTRKISLRIVTPKNGSNYFLKPLPSLLSVVESHKRFTRYKEIDAVPYLRSRHYTLHEIAHGHLIRWVFGSKMAIYSNSIDPSTAL
jgi:hypothetical protein